MKRTPLTLAIALACALAPLGAVAQETAGAGRFEIGAFPGGGIFFTKGDSANEPKFGNYPLGATFALNLNRLVGLEGEVGGNLGRKQSLVFNGTTLTKQKTPSMWMYQANVVATPGGNDRALVPFVTAGIGGLTMCDCNREDVATLGVTGNSAHLTGNVGGGLKWFSANHWGARADYRFFAVKSADAAPEFFGQTDTRYGHRIYGGMLLTY